MVVPPAEAACSMPGQRELLLQRSDLLPLTVQVFEMVHFGTYQLDLISTYSRLSCIIEMDMDLAQHSLRKVKIRSKLKKFVIGEINVCCSRRHSARQKLVQRRVD